MAKSFNEKLIEVLKTDSRFIDDEGELIKAAVIDRAWKIDHDLVRLLLGKPEIKKKFFDEIEKHWIFNINTFIEFISDKNFLANSYTRFRQNIRLTIGEKTLQERGEVSLVWPYKDCVLEGGQTKEEEKRKEIFFNEILAQDEIDRLFDPKVLTNWKRYTVDGEQKVTEIKRDENGTIKENLIIKGNNLLSLHTLKKQFRGKVKLIYIDPPYNTGNDSFGYNDSFCNSAWLTFMKNRLEIAWELLSNDGIIFCNINHIMLGYLLCLFDDIFGRANKLPIVTLKAGTTASYRSINDCPVNVSEYIVAYSKNSNFKPNTVYREAFYSEDYSHYITNFEDAKPSDWKLVSLAEIIHKENGCNTWHQFREKFGNNWKKKRFEQMEDFALKNKEAIVSLNTLQKPSAKIQKVIDSSKKNRNKVHICERDKANNIYCYNGRTLAFFSEKFREIDGRVVPAEILTNIWDDISFLGIGPEGQVSLPNGKKPEELIKRIINLSTEEKDIILDFHLGSGTTAAVAHKMGKQYIGIEQFDYGKNDSVTRLKNVIGKRENGKLVNEFKDYDKSGISKVVNWQGGGDFVYCELMKYNEVFMDKIQKVKTPKELVELWKYIAENSFLNWYVNPEMPQEAVNDFIEIGKSENGLDKQKKLLAELLNKNQLYVNLSEIEDADFKVSAADKKLNREFHGKGY